MTLRVGVIGVGMMGQDHVRRFNTVVTGCKVVAVSDSDLERAGAIPGVRVHLTGHALIEDPEVDAVVVASWGPTHEEFVLACLAAGKPVFCEKPLAPTRDACLRLIKAEVARGRRLVQVGFMRRYDPAFCALKSVVEAGTIGTPLLMHSAHRNASVPGHFTADMMISDTAVHDIDVARWMLDDEIVAATVVRPRRNRRSALGDPVILLLEMAGGAIVDVEISVNIAYGYDIRGEVVGETGVVALADSNSVVTRTAGSFSGRVPEDWRERFRRAYDLEMQAWVAAAALGTAAGPSTWDGYAATVVADAGLESLSSGRRIQIVADERPALYSA